MRLTVVFSYESGALCVVGVVVLGPDERFLRVASAGDLLDPLRERGRHLPLAATDATDHRRIDVERGSSSGSIAAVAGIDELAK